MNDPASSITIRVRTAEGLGPSISFIAADAAGNELRRIDASQLSSLGALAPGCVLNFDWADSNDQLLLASVEVSFSASPLSVDDTIRASNLGAGSPGNFRVELGAMLNGGPTQVVGTLNLVTPTGESRVTRFGGPVVALGFTGQVDVGN